MSELLALIVSQQEDDWRGWYARDRPLEVLAGLNPVGLKRSRPRYFLSGRIVKRRKRSGEVGHGSTAMYKRGCRCDECRGEQSRRNKAWRARAKDPSAHPSPGASGAPKHEPTRNRVEAAGVDGLTALVQGDAPSG